VSCYHRETTTFRFPLAWTIIRATNSIRLLDCSKCSCSVCSKTLARCINVVHAGGGGQGSWPSAASHDELCSMELDLILTTGDYHPVRGLALSFVVLQGSGSTACRSVVGLWALL
jgi:hypothetical protein